MAEVHESAASLRFHGDDIDPEEISRILGCQPTSGAKKGGLWTTPNGTQVVARTGRWLLKTPQESPGDLDKQVAALFADLRDDLDAWKALAGRFRGNIFVGLFLSTYNEGIGLSPNTLSAIGLRGLELQLDIYSGRDDPEID
ncbi:DUF4279 domain-containing protein [Neorhizobium sp. P12A]|uniref:DUF4279 domain-containing protein n=1 Tax=Rhizobium/Agrobacterium group TaxID=227290 RepID=UPI001051262C|nr:MULTISPECIES: DUF4279 domain-containing protein [Rhizobium/Agrobacterium group]KAA0698328.1 DUF4279 domain-containing protein [Neorhizobium sp. P12A]TCR92899.1 uncharacterized protein DUF4279 [Rhizobium sp. BK376]